MSIARQYQRTQSFSRGRVTRADDGESVAALKVRIAELEKENARLARALAKASKKKGK